MAEGKDDGLLVLKQTGSSQAYYLNDKMVRKGAKLDVLGETGDWIPGRFEGQPLSNKPPTLLCNIVNPTDPETSIMRIFELNSQSVLRWSG